MNKFSSLCIGIALLAGVSAINASEPMQLTAAQMDKVTAGQDWNQILAELRSTMNDMHAAGIHVFDTQAAQLETALQKQQPYETLVAMKGLLDVAQMQGIDVSSQQAEVNNLLAALPKALNQ